LVIESLPDRPLLTQERTGYIVRGGGTKADVWTARLPGGRIAVVKDFRDKSWPVRLWGRLQISREVRFLRLLQGLDEVPRLLGQVDGLAFAMEKIEGEPLYRGRKPGPAWRPQLAALRRALDAFQARGVVHNDLRGRENIHLRPDGSIVILDWAGAACLRPGGVAHRLLFDAWKKIDDAAFIKWKQMLDPDSVTDEDRAFLRRFQEWRRLWPFNRKGVGGARNSA
jgi:predicted Ser/Thr protein kinase